MKSVRNNSKIIRENSDASNVRRNPVVDKSGNAKVMKVKVDSTVDSRSLSTAVQEKTVVNDPAQNRILAFTDDSVLVIDEKLQKALTITAQNILKKFKDRVNGNELKVISVAETLTYFECTNAAFIDTPKFNDCKKELNAILADLLKNGDGEQKKTVKTGIIEFFERSDKNITRGVRKFKNIPYSIENSEEKEFLRHIFIAEMFAGGVFEYSFLVENGIITNMNFSTLDEVYRKGGLLSNEEFENACYLIGAFESRDEILEYYSQADRKFLTSYATPEELARFVVDGKIPAKESVKKLRLEAVREFSPELIEELLEVTTFPKGTEFIEFVQEQNKVERYINKRFLSSLDREKFLKIVLSQKIKYKNPYESEDYINAYGKINSDDIIFLVEKGLVKPEDVIKLTQFTSVEFQNPDEYNKMIENQLDFYSFERLQELLKSNKLNKKFVEMFNDFLNNRISKEQRKQYFERMSKEISEKEDSEESLILLVKKGINIGRELNYEVSEEKLEEMFIEDKISESDLVKLYTNGLLSLESMSSLFSDNEILQNYRQGKLDYRVLNFLENRAEIIKKELRNGKISASNLMELYSSSDGISIEEFSHIAEDYDFKDENLSEYLSDDISKEKVEELFSNYYISQDDLTMLVGRNIITQKDADDFARRIATHEEYESMFNPDNRFIILTRETEGEKGNKTYYRGGIGEKRVSQIKNDPELQELLLDQIGFDDRALILRGNNNSLDGYKVFPSEDLGVMVFLKGEKAGNATYIMSLQQGMYFLNKMIRENRSKNSVQKTGVQIESDATKKELRETEHIKVRNAAAGWGANIVEDIKKLSPTFKSRMRGQTEYKKVIEDVIAEIRDDYKTRRDIDK